MTSAGQRVAAALAAAGVAAEIREFPSGTRTAADAAAAIGTTIGQIVKSLVFAADGRLVLVLASGANRVDERRLAAAAGAWRVVRADPADVRAATGFSIGGVPPIGHETPIDTFVDEALLAHDVVWAAAGTPTSVFAIDPAALRRITGARVLRVTMDGANEPLEDRRRENRADERPT
jgi:prolyl-tRNA editing enzyme YbaK/EbsC (Cys-tRNA(Pro) deacylase)